MNVLTKKGYLTDEEREEKLEHGCDYFTFITNMDLTEPIKIVPYVYEEVTINMYTKDIARFISWWTLFVHPKLNGFSGFANLKFEPVGFTIMND